MKGLEKLIDKKKSDMSDNERKAKMSVVKHLQDMASDGLKDKLDGLKKVTIASDSQEGLKAGLEKAHEILGQKQHDEMVSEAESGPDTDKSALDGEEDEESSESPEEEASEQESDPDEESEESIDAKLKELMAKKEALKSKK